MPPLVIYHKNSRMLIRQFRRMVTNEWLLLTNIEWFYCKLVLHHNVIKLIFSAVILVYGDWPISRSRLKTCQISQTINYLTGTTCIWYQTTRVWQLRWMIWQNLGLTLRERSNAAIQILCLHLRWTFSLLKTLPLTFQNL